VECSRNGKAGGGQTTIDLRRGKTSRELLDKKWGGRLHSNADRSNPLAGKKERFSLIVQGPEPEGRHRRRVLFIGGGANPAQLVRTGTRRPKCTRLRQVRDPNCDAAAVIKKEVLAYRRITT